ncbi:MAG: PBP1A family penicillin-binding protein [Alphaproteobacteria bacterium]|nr:PBP1A family penicillin-binding protein [Alphaproteobacteria bacterium]
MYRAPPFAGFVRRPPPAPPPPEQAAPRRRRSLRWRLLRWLVIAAIWSGLGLAAALVIFAWDLPRPESALDAVRRPSLSLEDRSGLTFATYGDVVGETLHLADLPPALPAAIVAVEDRRYWSHGGIDVLGILRAAAVDLTAGRVVQGGSTITQQVAKNLFLSNTRSFRRKVQELLLTFWLERHFSKAQILEIYLNRVYLGAGTFGVDAAARRYFGISARRVNLWQAAVLAGLPRAPSRFSPRTDPDAAAARAREVLGAMVQSGAITAAEAARASAQIAFPPSVSASWFADWAAEDAEALLPEGADAVARTTLDARLQRVAEAKLSALLEGPGAAAQAGEGAVVVLDAATGAVRAMVGGRDRRTSSFNRAVLARRQPGSAFKPFVWLAALEAGIRPDDTVEDGPIRVGGWSPANYDGRYRGAVTMEEGLAQSLNTVAVRLAEKAGGPPAVAAVAHRLGIAASLPDNLTIALGTGDVRLLNLTAAYAPFCNGGWRVTPVGIAAIVADGRSTPVPRPAPERVVKPGDAASMLRMLTAVVARGTGRAAAIPGRQVAGKTGTTQDFRDAWFVGCTAGAVIGVWIGNDDNHPMAGVHGGSLPARLFRQIALELRP